MNYTKGRKIYIAISSISVIAVAIIIFYLSDQTSTESAQTSDSLINLIFSFFGKLIGEETIRTLAHFCEFAGFSFLVANLVFSIKDKLKPIVSILLSFGYAITDEIHQIFIPGRAFQLSDLAVDLGGIVLGVVVFCFISFLNVKLKTRK